jgi:hypothetical protein
VDEVEGQEPNDTVIRGLMVIPLETKQPNDTITRGSMIGPLGESGHLQIGSGALGQEWGGVVEEVEGQVKEAPRHHATVHRHMRLQGGHKR